MEFLRFGSSIPGSYWGCCAVDIIQNFKTSPSAKYAIEMVCGDGGDPVTGRDGSLFAGPTYLDVFKQRLRVGTFGGGDMPNHGFIAVLTESQIVSGYGKQWLAILKAHGFEFIRSQSNSVYTGQGVGKYSKARGSNKNYVFALFRNIGSSGDGNPYEPPEAWKALPKVKTEGWETMTPTAMTDAAEAQHVADTKVWNDLGPAKLHSLKELQELGLTDSSINMAGRRSLLPQQPKASRDAAEKAKAKAKAAKPAVAPWAK